MIRSDRLEQGLTADGQGKLIAKSALALAVVFLTGWWSATALFSDMFVGYAFWRFSFIVIATHIIPGAIIGFALPERWYLALGAAWGGVVIDGIPLLVFIVRFVRFGRHDYPSGVYGGSPLFGFAVIPAVLLLGGYVGYRLRIRRT